ncbi:uncharacterized protein cubi_01813 [Cryptosporidium ubiquitum]|uniref:Uncharacterized protein n=1 Tax=Cryptosporidium ubiquitum TaxID=857276 RepID=A0A1J4MQK9_9CRYT|nr:uncharacterized protein cubi_01813 [Cryptosporidium ubiquitum]OII75292.1 hypothetical protein cubi_01813 [Cryptosporidium ubiquitum]
MRRLQSFKTPSRLSEKLKLSSKTNSNNDTKISNGIKFVPNVRALDSNEAINNDARTDNISLKNINFVRKLEFEKMEQPDNTHKFDASLIPPIHGGEIINKAEKQDLIYDSNKVSVNLTINNTINIYKNLEESEHGRTPEKLEGWSVFQLPKYMPENEKNFEFIKMPIPTLLHDTPSGSIGKLVFKRDGNIDLSLNSSKGKECISFKIDCISRDNSEQFIIAFSKINELINLGKCDSLLIGTPEI